MTDPEDVIHEEAFLASLHDEEAQIALPMGPGTDPAQAMRAAELPTNLGLTTGPRAADLHALREMVASLDAMLVGPRVVWDRDRARRHLRLLIARMEMESGLGDAPQTESLG